MIIRVINANTNAAMTRSIARSAQAIAGPDVTIEGVTSAYGPEAIEGHSDVAMSVPGVLAAVDEGERLGASAHVIACFSDPGLMAARERATAPVVGIAEAAMRTATYVARRFSVVTTLARSAPYSVELSQRYGVGGACAGVHASGVAVNAVESDPQSRQVILETSLRALEADESEAIVLGCAGMTDFVGWLSQRLGVPVIDGVAAATTTAVGLVAQGLSTSKVGELAAPEPTEFRGDPAAIHAHPIRR